MKHILTIAISSLAALGSFFPTLAGDLEDPILPEQAIIRLRPGFSIDDFNAQYQTSTIDSITSRNIHLIELPDGADETQWIAQLRANPPQGYVWAELNYEGQDGEGRTGSFYVSGLQSGDLYGTQWAIDRIGLRAAQQQSTGQGIIVAVIDTGVDPTHPELAQRVLPNGYNFITGTNDTRDLADGIDNDDDGLTDESFGHGTFIAGLVALAAPDARILPIVVLNSDGHSSSFYFAAGAFYAIDQGADVINMSLGSTYDSQAIQDAVNEGLRNGIAIIGAAGNRNIRDPKEYPATTDDSIGVASTDRNDRKAPFSNYHGSLLISAPGVEIHSTIPRTAQGHRFARWEGTSLSTALVSGTAALIAAAHPQWPAATRALAIEDAIEKSATEIDDNGEEWEGGMGEGLLNALGAVDETPEVAQLVDAQMTLGAVIEGTVDQLLDDREDDRSEDVNGYLIARSEMGTELGEQHRLELRLDFVTNIRRPSAWELTIRDRMNLPNGSGRVFIRNQTTGALELVRTYLVPSPNDGQQRIIIQNPRRFIAADGSIEVRIRHSLSLSFLIEGFVSHFDWVEIDVD